MNSGKELRKYTRITMKVAVEIERVRDRVRRPGHTECLSMNGLFIECDAPFSLGTECIVKILVGGPESDVLVHAKGKVAYVDEDGMAVEMMSHLDMNSYNHLRNLVLYNADHDAEIVEGEIKSHLDRIRDRS